MKTVSTLFTAPIERREVQPIEFTHYLADSTRSVCPKDWIEINMGAHSPADYDNVKLIAKGIVFDTIAAWDNDGDDENGVTIFLGHWNDGVVGLI